MSLVAGAVLGVLDQGRALAAPVQVLPPPSVEPVDDLFGPRVGIGAAPEVAQVPATSATIDPLERRLAELEAGLGTDMVALAQGRTDAAATAIELAAVQRTAERRRIQLDRARAAESTARDAMTALIRERFIRGDDLLVGVDPALDSAGHEDLMSRRALTSAATKGSLDAADHTSRRRAELAEQLAGAEGHREELTVRSQELATLEAELSASIVVATQRIATTRQEIDAARLTATVRGTDMSVVALDAYWRAARLMSVIRPQCGLEWWMLAGIGRVESHHGTYRRDSLNPDGTVSAPFYGPELDGSDPRFRVIVDTDGGALDGSTKSDRAVGPMQFLPGSWRANSADNTGDGIADPQNIYDSAAAAGIYLCRNGPGLGDEARLREAYLSYNRSQVYVEDVLGYGLGYREAVPI